jgi:hypothetical protein
MAHNLLIYFHSSNKRRERHVPFWKVYNHGNEDEAGVSQGPGCQLCHKYVHWPKAKILYV